MCTGILEQNNIDVLIAMGITILGPAAFFTSITYISPMMTTLVHFSETGVTFILFVFGLGLFIGNILGGKLADKSLMPLLLSTLALQSVVLFIFYFTAANQIMSIICVFLMAASGFATVSPIQHLVMIKASRIGAPNLASAFNIGLFNLGNAMGAWLGG